jgi:hypothetical protein
MKIIVTTSDKYHHCLPHFFYAYNKHWGDPFELVGYKKPEITLPSNCTFVSLGKQRGPEYFGDDMAEYFSKQDDWFVWMMEDTFIRSFDRNKWIEALQLISKYTGRINLTKEGMNREHKIIDEEVYFCSPDALYRLSTMPSIWNRDFLLRYMKPGLTPWKFELQPTNDDSVISGLVAGVLTCNEGVRKHDIHKLNLEGIYD